MFDGCIGCHPLVSHFSIWAAKMEQTDRWTLLQTGTRAMLLRLSLDVASITLQFLRFNFFSASRQNTVWRQCTCNTTEEDSSVFCLNPNALVAISNEMQTAKLCSFKIFQFLTGGTAHTGQPCNGCKMVVVELEFGMA